jgi:hypothetical protein
MGGSLAARGLFFPAQMEDLRCQNLPVAPEKSPNLVCGPCALPAIRALSGELCRTSSKARTLQTYPGATRLISVGQGH